MEKIVKENPQFVGFSPLATTIDDPTQGFTLCKFIINENKEKWLGVVETTLDDPRQGSMLNVNVLLKQHKDWCCWNSARWAYTYFEYAYELIEWIIIMLILNTLGFGKMFILL